MLESDLLVFKRIALVTFADDPYTIPAGVFLVSANLTDGGLLVELPSAAANPGREIILRHREGGIGTNTIDINFFGADTLDGGLVAEPGVRNDGTPGTGFLRLISDGISSWYSAGGYYFDND